MAPPQGAPGWDPGAGGAGAREHGEGGGVGGIVVGAGLRQALEARPALRPSEIAAGVEDGGDGEHRGADGKVNQVLSVSPLDGGSDAAPGETHLGVQDLLPVPAPPDGAVEALGESERSS